MTHLFIYYVSFNVNLASKGLMKTVTHADAIPRKMSQGGE